MEQREGYEGEKRNRGAGHNFRTGSGSIPRRLRVELVFNSESFVREAIFLG